MAKKSLGELKRVIDYEALYELLKQGPLSYADIEKATGTHRKNVPTIITTLSLKFPVYSPQRGVYALLQFDE